MTIEETIAKIKSLEGRPAVDEYHYNRDDAQSDSIERATAWVGEFGPQLEMAGLSWDSPCVQLDESGNVALQWWSGEKSTTVYFEGDGANAVSYSPNGREFDGPVGLGEQRMLWWLWLKGGDAQ